VILEQYEKVIFFQWIGAVRDVEGVTEVDEGANVVVPQILQNCRGPWGLFPVSCGYPWLDQQILRLPPPLAMDRHLYGVRLVKSSRR
jgi:hypothetical protein